MAQTLPSESSSRPETPGWWESEDVVVEFGIEGVVACCLHGNAPGPGGGVEVGTADVLQSCFTISPLMSETQPIPPAEDEVKWQVALFAPMPLILSTMTQPVSRVLNQPQNTAFKLARYRSSLAVVGRYTTGPSRMGTLLPRHFYDTNPLSLQFCLDSPP